MVLTVNVSYIFDLINKYQPDGSEKFGSLGRPHVEGQVRPVIR